MSKIIRTPTYAAGGITADEKRQMDALSKVWIERAFRILLPKGAGEFPASQ